MIDAKQIKELREKTGISVAECKKALETAAGDMAKALELLRERGAEMAGKKSDRELAAGVVASYIHGLGSIGALVELASETDFVSKNEEFRAMAADIAMHVAAVGAADVAELLAQEFIKDPSQTIEALIQAGTQKFGERIELRRFARFQVGA